MKIDKETIVKQFKESPTIKTHCYIFRQLKELYGEAFTDVHYLVRDDMVDQYYFDHQEEIDAMFPGNHI